MTVHINGEERILPDLPSVSELVKHLTLPAATLLIEHNGTALRRAEWETTPLSEEDRIELLRIAAGG